MLMGDITSVLALDHLQHRLHQVTKQETSCIILKAEDSNGSDVFRVTNDLPAKTALEPEREQEKGPNTRSGKESPIQRELEATGLTWGTAPRRAQDRGY